MTGPKQPDLADAITALTAFLKTGSVTRDPQEFDRRQLDIERDFRALLSGLGRDGSDRPGQIVRPVLSNGHLQLGAPLPAEAHLIGGYTRYRREVWLVLVAEATRNPGTPTHLQHPKMVIEGVVRLRVFDASGRRILVGFPRIVESPSVSRTLRRRPMFRTLARLLAASSLDPPDADGLFTIHPLQLSRWLEEAWAHSGEAAWPGFDTSPTGITPDVVNRFQLPDQVNGGLLNALRSGVGIPGEFSPPPATGIVPGTVLPWDHLIYAFLVESTGVVEILREVVRRYVVGETLEAVSDTTYGWVRATEELFFRNPPLFSITDTVSALRPDPRINRRNAYWRMFGMDLPHAPSGIDRQPWKTDVGASANLRFGEVWIELLRQVWIAIENDSNAVGANPTDAGYIGYLCQTLSEMMGMRRRAGMLAREEFGHVVTMSWFHLLVETENQVVIDLQASAGAAGNPADRLTRIAQRVGITPPRRARELFELADLVSPVLMFIEAGRFNTPTDAELLFRSGSTSPVVRDTMNRLIDLWQSATGQPLKEAAVRISGPRGSSTPSAQPVRLPSAQLPTAPASTKTATNGTAAPVRL